MTLTKGATTIRTTRGWTTVPSAALLLALQLAAGTAEPLAHAREPETAPIGIEAHHDAHCIVIHDALRCALCQYAGSRVVPRPRYEAVLPATHPERPVPRRRITAPPPRPHLSARPRAPPSLPA